MRKREKTIAAFFLVVMTVEMLMPITTYALTGGPSQPETQQFQPVSAANMVDLSTGDFTYSIPLMDVGGYPITLSYSANNTGVEDEASNVGLGWNINIGSVSRQLRGVPDDFNGDALVKKKYQLPMKSAEIGLAATTEVTGLPLPMDLTQGFTVGWSNYWGYYGKYSFRPSISAQMGASGKLTLGLGVEASSHDGLSLAPSVSLAYSAQMNEMTATSVGLGLNSTYNTRHGMKSMTLSGSASVTSPPSGYGVSASGSATINFVGESYYPVIEWPRKSETYSLDVSIGPTLWPLNFLGTIKGMYSEQGLDGEQMSLKSYGSMYSVNGKNDNKAVLDFSREKDGSFNPKTPNLAIPVISPDIFSATSHMGSSQFMLKSSSSGIFYDSQQGTKSHSVSAGVEFGGGPGAVKVGGNAGVVLANSVVKKWDKENQFNQIGNFKGGSNEASTAYESVYARKVGNISPVNKEYFERAGMFDPVRVNIKNSGSGYTAESKLVNQNGVVANNNSPINRTSREQRNDDILFLTANEVDGPIKSYSPGVISLAECNEVFEAIPRTDPTVRKGHHIGEIRMTNPEGKRLVYGLPVYNLQQREVTFAVDKSKSVLGSGSVGLVSYKKSEVAGRSIHGKDNFYQEDITAPYANSFLLTQILSPDYVDRTNNGVTDDDFGDGIKFNYTRTSAAFGWRTPFTPYTDVRNEILGGNFSNTDDRNIASLNQGFKSKNDDDKGSFVSGSKEIWNVHSIESKGFYAIFDYDATARKDMLGISPLSDQTGSAIQYQEGLKKLKSIRLYSKADIIKYGHINATPIKTVHLTQDYSLGTNLPNSKELNSGKLTLKSVYFTYGKNDKGRLSPYVFTYNTPSKSYGFQMQDRWGNYKHPSQNPGGMSNIDYPYAIQDKATADVNIALWKLEKIGLPSGGTIEVKYESDDYGYVQNKRAMRMFPLGGVGTLNSSTGLIDADAFVVQTPVTLTKEEFKALYLEKQDFLLYKLMVNLDNKGHNEYVQGYAKIKKNDIDVVASSNGKAFIIPVEKIQGINPVAHTAWQMMRSNLPEYAYRSFNNPKGGPEGIIRALVSIGPTLKDELTGFSNRAKKSNFSNNIDLTKSFVRLCEPTYKKLGGGHRVKEVKVKDEWSGFSTSGPSYSQTIVYDYSTNIQDATGKTISNASSGVTAYEPLMANEENPFRQPILYEEHTPFTMINTYTLEDPMGESYFPSPQVVYQQVKASTFGADGLTNTGYTLNEFYTTKDFPTLVKQTNLARMDHNPSFILSFLKVYIHRKVGVSQGYSVELNDMHGKPKSVQVFDLGGAKTSATYYYYKSESIGQNEYRLKNDVDVIGEQGVIRTKQMGVDVDLFHDMRYEETKNDSYEVDVNVHTMFFAIFPIVIPFGIKPPSYERTEFFGSSSIKIINRTGILDRVVKMENGSQIESANLLWDEETGENLLIRTQNEFEDNSYSFSYPAHLAYKRMGGAYKNSGLVIKPFNTDVSANILTSVGLLPGDELINLSTKQKLWVSPSSAGTGSNYKLIDMLGELVTLQNGAVKVVRSANRNLLAASVGSVVSMENPITGTGDNRQINISAVTRVLSASAVTYSDEWIAPYMVNRPKVPCTECPPDYVKMNTVYPGYDPDVCLSSVQFPLPNLSPSNGSIVAIPPRADYVSTTNIYSSFNSSGSGTVALSANNVFWRDRMRKRGVWNSLGANTPFYETTLRVYIPTAKTYYLGLFADDVVTVKKDGTTILQYSGTDDWHHNVYHLYPVNLTVGFHTFSFSAFDLLAGIAGIGFELYDNTAAQLSSAGSAADLNVLFSSGALAAAAPGIYYMGDYNCGTNTGLAYKEVWEVPYVEPQPRMYCRTYNTLKLSSLTCYECQSSENRPVNPYTAGIKGTWRPQVQWAYNENRNQPVVNNSTTLNGTDIRNSGAYVFFNPFWSGSFTATPSGWTKANEITLYNPFGQELENKNALGQYSAAQFGFNNTLPIAVAANSRYNEIAYEGFEDLLYPRKPCGVPDICNATGPFKINNFIASQGLELEDQKSHSGKYSLSATSAFTIINNWRLPGEGKMIDYDLTGRSVLQPTGINWGFAPSLEADEKYIFSIWVRDEVANGAGNKPGITFSFYGNQSVIDNPASNTYKWGPVIDGWRRLEIIFSNKSSTLNIYNITQFGFGCSAPANKIYLDDIRIYPYKGQMKSFAYDAVTLKLMAELDENNYATFYEYDDEGSLIRVKKETERGIQTISESRTYQRKNPLIN